MYIRRDPPIGLFVICCFCLCFPIPGEAFFSLSSISPALERVANYGYSMLGYPTPSYGYDNGIELYEKEPIWDGHIAVGKFVSPLLDALGVNGGGGGILGGYGQDRVVKGYDNRLGLRVAVPYIGDFQVTREIGPGIFLDKLGPGKYPYSHLPSKGKGHQGYGHTGYGHGGYAPPPKVAPIPVKAQYQSLQNYPWYNR